jgi:large repetitive protein
MKQYMQILPICLRMLLLLVVGQLPLMAYGQDLSDSRWYYGNSTQWLSFEIGRVVPQTGQYTPYGTAGSVVATDYRSGDLLFYSDGVQLIGPDGQPVGGIPPLPGDPSLPQPVHAVPIPGVPNTFYLFFITPARGMAYGRYDATAQTYTPLGNLNIGGEASGVMEVVRGASNDNYVYWLVVPLRGDDARFTLLRIEDTLPVPTPTTIIAETGVPGFNPVSMTFHYRNNLLAVGNGDNADLPVMLFSIDLDDTVPDPSRLSFEGNLPAITSGGCNISGLAWILNYLYVSKEQGADANGSGNLFRYNLTDWEGGQEPTPMVVDNAIAYRSYGLRTSTNDQVYHLLQPTAGGPIITSRVNGYSAANPRLDQNITGIGATNFRGTQFSRSAFPASIPVTIDFDYSSACAQAPTYFYPIFGENGPDEVNWFINDERASLDLQPFFVFSQPGTVNIKMRALYPGTIKEINKDITIAPGLQLNLQPEYIICPDASETITLEIQDANGEPATVAPENIIWYKPLSVLNVGKPATETGESIEVSALMSQRMPDGSFPEAGTYYVVVNTGQCELYAAFEVVVYNNEYFKFNTWYFGDGAGINFNVRPAEATPAGENQMQGANDSALEGTTISADANADILFYTNGETLWTRDADGDGVHDRAPNGDALNGTPLGGSRTVTQNSLLIPHPNDPSLHYIFTITDQDDRSLRYSIADLKGNDMTNPRPDVEQARSSGDYVRGRLLFTQMSEKLAGTTNNGSGWIIGHELGNNRFISYAVKPEGIGSPEFSQAGSIINEAQSKGYMALSPNDSLLAMAIPNAGGGNLVEIFRFDSKNGRVQDGGYVRINVPAEGGASIYGLSFSPNSKRIWVTTTGSTSYLYQMSIDSAFTKEKIQGSLVQVAEVGEELGAIQLAPDNFLYVARNGMGNVGAIQNPDDSLHTENVAGVWNAEGIIGGLNGRSLLGLPNLIQPAGRSVMDPTVFAMSACQSVVGQNEEVVVYGTRRYNNETLIFRFFDITNPGTQLQELRAEEGIDSVTVSLPPGDYRVELLLEACDLQYPTDYDDARVVEGFFSISPKATAGILNDGTDPTICEDQSVVLQGEVRIDGQPANAADYLYAWFNAVTGEQLGSEQNLTVTEAGVYRLEALNQLTGCPADPADISVLDARPDAELGDDFGVCAGEPLPVSQITASGVPANHTIEWFRSTTGPNGTFNPLQNSTTTQSLADINTAQAGTYIYVIKVSGSSCFRTDSLTITVGATPLVNLRPTNNNCTGTADLVAEVRDGVGPYSYLFFREGSPLGSGNGGVLQITESGSYSVQVIDDATGCVVTSEAVAVDVMNPLQDLRIDVLPGCSQEGQAALNELTASSSYSGQVTYQWFRLRNGAPDGPAIGTGESIFVPNGSYRVVARTDNPACASGESSADTEVQSVVWPAAYLLDRYTVCPSIPELSRISLELPGYTGLGWYNRTTGQLLSRESTFVITTEGEYEVRVEGCTDPVVFRVAYDCTPQLYLPNAIRIGGVNGTFSILNKDMIPNMEEFDILIYNRWGEVIYQSSDAAFEWRGTGPNGKAVPMANYAYLIRYRNRFGENREIKKIYGSVFVMY